MKCLFSIVFVFKLSICIVILSSLYSELPVFTCSTVSLKELFLTLLLYHKMPKYESARQAVGLFD